MADEAQASWWRLSDWYGLEDPSYGSDTAPDPGHFASVLIIGGVLLPILGWGIFLLLGGSLPDG
ncbi:hypothetical protein [Sabulicella rubraurantiaca]|uniref:hypothetical protein n=1 Tax=Sabulicella rubraurantiaca TaxID=2811429 RepID=UPI001A97C72E|nr:hypothetical protein [Sabulicella rubraurantiaca]